MQLYSMSTPEGYIPTRDIEAGEWSEEGDQTRWFNFLEIWGRVETNYEPRPCCLKIWVEMLCLFGIRGSPIFNIHR